MGLFPKTYLRWYEPRAVRRAIDSIVATKLGVAGRLTQKLCFALPITLLLLLNAAATYFIKGKIAVSWSTVIAMSLFAGLFLAYFVEFIVWLFPREIRFAEHALLRAKGQAFDAWKYEEIDRIELASAEFDSETVRIMLVHLAPDSGRASPVLIGIAPKIAREELLRVLAKCGVAATGAGA